MYKEYDKTDLINECQLRGIEHKQSMTMKELVGLLERDDEVKAGGQVKESKPKPKRFHTVFGEYRKCKIHPQVQFERHNRIYLGINAYSFEVAPRKEVYLPIKVIEFAKKCTFAEHVWDGDAHAAEGTVEGQATGGHVTQQVEKYVVEILD